MAAFKIGNLGSPVRVRKTTPHIVLDAMLAWSGPFEHVFAKLLPVNERSIEAVCAWLAREIELPVPEPRFLRVTRTRMPQGCMWPFGEASEQVVFGTVAIEQVQQLVRTDSSTVDALLDRWPALATAAAYDQLIANDDRTSGNILLGPHRDLWLIDHGRALGGGGNKLFSTEVAPLFDNLFLHRIANYKLSDRMRLRPALMTACLRLSGAVPRIPYDGLLVPDDIATQIDTFLQRRVTRLQAMILDQIGLPDLYDQGSNPRTAQ